MMLRRIILVLLFPLVVCATETENLGIRIVPTPGKVTIDGKFDDWDLSGGIFSCKQVEQLRNDMSIWYHVMYDADNIYFLARFRDPNPMANDGVVGADHAWRNDCLQARTIVNYGKPNERVTHFTCWQGRDEKTAIEITYGRGFKSGSIKNAVTVGGKQRLRKDDDGKGYVQEFSVPLKLICPEGETLKAGSRIRITFECRLDWGVNPKCCFFPGVKPDRIFAFRAYKQFGPGTFMAKGNIEPQPVRLADGREFKVTMQKGIPTVDWTGLIASKDLPGFKELFFEMPEDGYVSLNIKDADGTVVRQLLAQDFRAKGKHTVKWDGLTTWKHRTPGQPVAAGNYTWEGIRHPGIGLRLVGWASGAGFAPWDSTPNANWGGDHGNPISCEAQDKIVVLGWSGAEAGKAIVATDLNGRPKWRQRYRYGATRDLTIDDKTVYVLYGGDFIFRLDLKGGFHTFWEGSDATELYIHNIWNKPEGMPVKAASMDAANGKIYLGFAGVRFAQADIKDWKAFITQIKSGKGPAAKIWKQIPNKFHRGINGFLKGKLEQKHVRLNAILNPLNGLLNDPSLQPNGKTLSASELASANYKTILAGYPGLFVTRRNNFVAAIDAGTGKLQATWDVPAPIALEAVSDELVYVVSGGKDLLAFNPKTKSVKTLVKSITAAKSVSADAAGKIYVGTGAPENQVLVYTPDGKLQKRIGKRGGRPQIGRFDPEGMHSIAGVCVDQKGQLWVMERDKTPNRISVWNTKDGALVREFFGAAHYGASGGAVNPKDPLRMLGEGCEWQLDPETGMGKCLYTIRGDFNTFSRYCIGSNGREYATFAVRHKYERKAEIEIHERLEDGSFELRAIIYGGSNEGNPRVWSDANDDQQQQPNEVAKLPVSPRLIGYNGWSSSINVDLSLIDGSTHMKKEARRRGPPRVKVVAGPALQLRVQDFTKCGAPLYEAKILPQLKGLQHSLVSLDGKKVLTTDPGGRDHYGEYRCYETATGKLLWCYPNGWFGVHGSHRAPPSEPGLIRGAFGLVGCANVPTVGNVWAVNSNVGEWYLLTEDGFFLTRLFEGDRIKIEWPKEARPGAVMDKVPPGLGGEDFGGSMTQTTSGQVHVQAGKTADWNVKVVGLDRIRRLNGGQVSMSAKDVATAAKLREQLLQKAIGNLQYEIVKKTPKFTGNIGRDFKGLRLLDFGKTTDAKLRVAATYDDRKLYLAWQVNDKTPWVNGAGLPEMMYARGDTVDFQIGTDPQANEKRRASGLGDLRLSIGNLKGKPTAVIYRRVAKEKKNPKVFSSGVVARFEVASVVVLDNADIKVNVDGRNNRYTVEAAIPLSALGLTPKGGLILRGDFGATHGDAAGNDTVRRSYWSNQQTGLVDDEVFELKLQPSNWGELIFGK